MNRRLVSCGIAALSVTSLLAEETPAPLVIERIPEKIVSATRTLEEPAKTTTTASIVTSAEIADKKMQTVVQALQSLPGVTVVQSGTPGQSTSVFVRGTESNHTLLTVDGRRQTPNLLGGYDFANLSLDNVDRIEMVRTPSSTLYGGDTIGGVINIVTKTGRGLKEPEYEAFFEAGSFQTLHGGVATRGAVGAFDYAVAASYLSADYPRENSDYDLGSIRGSVGYQLHENFYVDLKGHYYDSLAGSPGPTTFFDPLAELDREVTGVSPGFTWDINEQWTTKAYYSYDFQYQRYLDSFGTDNRQRLHSHQVDWQVDYQVSDPWTLSAGVLIQEQAFRQHNAAGVEDIRANQTSVGGYLQSQWKPHDRFQLVQSIRYDRYSDYDSAFTWRNGVSYRIPKVETRVFGNISTSYSPPTPGDLYFPGFSNPDLDPEESFGWEIGVEQKLAQDRLTLSATYFRNEIDDLIQFVFPIPLNVSEALTEGIESSLKWDPCKMFSLQLNYTYLTAINDVTEARLVRRPRHQVGAGLVVRPHDRVTLYSELSWMVDREDVSAATFTQGDAEDILLVRGGVSWQVQKNVQLYVRGENLSDEKYEAVDGFPTLRFGAYGGVRLTF